MPRAEAVSDIWGQRVMSKTVTNQERETDFPYVHTQETSYCHKSYSNILLEL